MKKYIAAVLLLFLGTVTTGDAQGIRLRRRVSSAPQTPTFVPTGNGALTTWTANGAATAWEAVDDPPGSPDDDATYASKVTNDGSHLFTFATPSITGTVNSVTVTTRWRAGSPTFGIVWRTLRVGGTNYSGSTTLLSSQNYSDSTTTWVTNPRTGVAWTADDVNGIGVNALQQFGVGVSTLGGVESVFLTSTYLSIDYTAGGGGGGSTPAAPTGFSPADNATNVPVTFTLSCDQQADATSYRMFLSTTSPLVMDASTELTLADPSMCSHLVTGLNNNDEYFWNVCPVNGNGENCAGPTQSFTTEPAGGEMDLVAEAAACSGPFAGIDSPTGRRPRLLWTCELQQIWNQMKADFEATGCSSAAAAGNCAATPATRGGRWFKKARAAAIAPAGVYGDGGQLNGVLYQWTGDADYITNATFGLWKKIEGYLASAPPRDVNVSRVEQAKHTLMLEWAWPALTAQQRLDYVAEIDQDNDYGWWTYAQGQGRWSDADQTIGQTYFPMAMMAFILPNNASNNAIWNDANMGGYDAEDCVVPIGVGAANNNRDGICVIFDVLSAGGEYNEGPMYSKETIPYTAFMARSVSVARGVDTYPEITEFMQTFGDREAASYTPDLQKQLQYADEQNPNVLLKYYAGSAMMAAQGYNNGTPAGERAQGLLNDLITEHGEDAIWPGVIKWWSIPMYNPYGAAADWKISKTHYSPGQGTQYLKSGFTDSDSLFIVQCPEDVPFQNGEYNQSGYDHQPWYHCAPYLYQGGEWMLDQIGSYAGVSAMAEGHNGMTFQGFGHAKEFHRVRSRSLADTHSYYSLVSGGSIFPKASGFSGAFGGPPPVFLNEGSVGMLGVPGPITTIIQHHRASVDDITPDNSDLNRYVVGCGEFSRTHITQQHAKQEWLWHIPVNPTVVGGVFTWTTPVTKQLAKLTNLLPAAATRTVFDLATTFATNQVSSPPPIRCGWSAFSVLAGPWPGYTVDADGYDRKLLKIWPSTMGQFHTYLNVYQVGTSAPATPTLITNNNAECAHVVTTGQNDILACFNGATATILSNTAYDPAHKPILDNARLRSAGSFTIPLTTVAGTLEMHLADLPPLLACTYNMDGAGAVSIPSGGAGGLTETGGYARIPIALTPGAHSLVVSCS